MNEAGQEKRPIRIVIADDHRLVREGLRRLLENMTGMEIVAEAADGHELIEKADKSAADVALVDIGMPGLNGLEAIRRLHERGHPLRCIVLSMHSAEEYVIQALRYGARGFLLKDANTSELELGIRAVARDEVFLCPSISRRVIEDYLSRVGEGETSLDLLTGRQREILQLVAEGYSTKKIAAKLDISVKTVEAHRSELMRRLDIHDVPGLVRYAMRVGLISPDSSG